MIEEMTEMLNSIFKEEPVCVMDCNIYKKDVMSLREG